MVNPQENSPPISTSITITYHTCSTPTHQLLLLAKTYETNDSEEFFTINDKATDEVLYQSPRQYQEPSLVENVCVSSSAVVLHLYDNGNDGWKSNSRLTISTIVNSYEYIYGVFYLSNGHHDSFPLYLDFAMNIFLVPVHYHLGFLPPGWTANNYDDSLWPLFDYDYTPDTTTNIWAFRSYFSMNPVTQMNFTSYEVTVKVTGSVAIFVNEMEVFREGVSEGPITNSTTPISGRSLPNYYTITLPWPTLQIGVNHIAIAMFNSYVTTPLFFDLSVRFLTLNRVLPRYSSYFVFTSPTPSYSINNLFDMNPYSSFESFFDPSLQYTIQFDFGDFRYEYINKYCLTGPWMETIHHSPASWNLYGSTDRTEMNLLSTVPNMSFSFSYQRICFSLNHTAKSYRYYYFIIKNTTSNTYVQFNQLSFLTFDYNNTYISPFAFNTRNITAYLNASFPDFYCLSELYTNFSIDPPLPSSLRLNRLTGHIRGIPQQMTDPITYLVTARNPFHTLVSIHITITILFCEPTSILFTLFVNGGIKGEEQLFTLYNSMNEVLYTQQGVSSNIEHSFPFCVPPDTYFLLVEDQYDDGWNGGSYTIRLQDQYVFASGSLGSAFHSKLITIPLYYLIHPFHSEWKYSDSSSLPSHWNTPEYDDCDWLTITTEPPVLSETLTTYYRKNVTLQLNVDLYSSLEFIVRTTGGFIFYLNGFELFRGNLPASPAEMTSETPASVLYEEPVLYSFSLSATHYHVGVNQLSIEFHRFSTQVNDLVNDIFLPSVLAVHNYTLMMDSGCGFSTTPSDEQNYLFDSNSDTLERSLTVCNQTQYTYQFKNENKRFINTYEIITGPNCNRNHPTSWLLEGSEDGVSNWVFLDQQMDIYSNQYSQFYSFKFYNTKAFNSYRFTVLGCMNSKISDELENEISCRYDNNTSIFQLADILFYTTTISSFCLPLDEYHASVDGGYAYADCNPYYSGYKRRRCEHGVLSTTVEDHCILDPPQAINYTSAIRVLVQNQYFEVIPEIRGAQVTCTITPLLPSGLFFDRFSAKIFGKSSLPFQSNHTIHCMNKAGEVKTTLTLMCIAEGGTPSWLIFLTIFVLILFILWILMIVHSRCKHKRQFLQRHHEKDSSVLLRSSLNRRSLQLSEYELRFIPRNSKSSNNSKTAVNPNHHHVLVRRI